jgi:hypothetical protein
MHAVATNAKTLRRTRMAVHEITLFDETYASNIGLPPRAGGYAVVLDETDAGIRITRAGDPADAVDPANAVHNPVPEVPAAMPYLRFGWPSDWPAPDGSHCPVWHH